MYICKRSPPRIPSCNSIMCTQFPKQYSKTKRTTSLISQSHSFNGMSCKAKNPFTQLMKFKEEQEIPSAPKKEYRISLHILSNYGDPNEVTLGEIDVLEKDGVSIKDISISMDSDDSKRHLEYLHDGNLIKNCRDKMWVEPWDFKDGPIILNIKIRSSLEPDSIRLFNSRAGGDSNAKDFELYNDNLIINGTIPHDFVYLGQLSKVSLICKEILEDKEVVKKEHIHDKHGVIYIPEVRSIDVKLFSSFNSGKYIGLNSIELFDLHGKPIPYDNIASMEVVDGKCLTFNSNLLKLNKKSMRDEEMWVVEKENNKPIVLKIRLIKPFMVSLIRVWNYNGCEKSTEFSAKNITVTINRTNRIWSGRIRRGKGAVSLVRDSVTDIWLADSQLYKYVDGIKVPKTKREE